MKRSLDFSIEEFYHIYSRGVDKRLIFLDNADKQRFVRLLYLCNGSKPIVYKLVQGKGLDEIDVGDKLVSVGAYCLMNNHFHLLLKEKTDGGITKFMSKLMTAYSMYFNKKYKRTGALFESEFKAKFLNTDEYLKYIFSYIHLNPIKLIQSDWKEKGITDKISAKKYLNDYLFSSYYEYLVGDREESVILDKKEFPEYFTDFKDFESFIDGWLSFSEEI